MCRFIITVLQDNIYLCPQWRSVKLSIYNNLDICVWECIWVADSIIGNAEGCEARIQTRNRDLGGVTSAIEASKHNSYHRI